MCETTTHPGRDIYKHWKGEVERGRGQALRLAGKYAQ